VTSEKDAKRGSNVGRERGLTSAMARESESGFVTRTRPYTRPEARTRVATRGEGWRQDAKSAKRVCSSRGSVVRVQLVRARYVPQA